jgi:uncharacterized protein
VSLKQKISDDMKVAMRARDTARLGAIRLLQAAIKQREVDERIELSDADVLGVLDKMVKQRRDSIAQFEAAGRQELADNEKFEIEVLQAYMPQQLGAEEIDAAIEQAMAASGAAGPQDMGKVMGLLKPQLAGRADLGKVSGLVKARLSR